MKFRMMFATMAVAVVLPLCTTQAGQQFRLTFRGTSAETNASGLIINRLVSDGTWLQEFATAAGVTDLKSMAVVFNEQGNPMGDTIDIVNVTTGDVLTSLFGFYFGQDFGRMKLVSGDGRTIKRLDYIYTHQNSHSFGSAMVNQRYLVDRAGKTNRVSYQGTMQYIVTPENGNSLKMVSGSFLTGKLLNNPRSHP